MSDDTRPTYTLRGCTWRGVKMTSDPNVSGDGQYCLDADHFAEHVRPCSACGAPSCDSPCGNDRMLINVHGKPMWAWFCPACWKLPRDEQERRLETLALLGQVKERMFAPGVPPVVVVCACGQELSPDARKQGHTQCGDCRALAERGRV